MKTIKNDIISALKAHTFTIPVADDHILDAYPATEPAFESPYIFVREISNRDYAQTHTNKEEHSLISFEIEHYSKQQQVGTEILSPLDSVQSVAFESDAVIQSTFGLVRIGDPAPIPYDSDQTIMRYVLTYQGVIDLATDYLYRP